MDNTKTLPIEILVYIYKHLSGSDRAAACQTCKRWYDAASDNCFLKKKTVRIAKTLASAEPDVSTLKLFEESNLPYPNYFLKTVLINKMFNFWDNAGVNIRELTLKRCEQSEEELSINVLNKCPNLEILKIKSCSKSLLLGQLLDGGFNNAPTLNNLKTLYLDDYNDHNIHNISDALLISFVKAAPNLQELDISRCFALNHGRNRTTAESILTFEVIFEIIVERAQNLKRLSIPAKLINDATLRSLSEVENLNLDVLKVGSCSELPDDDDFFPELTNAGILALTSFQKNLRVLNIGWCSGVTDQSLTSICHNLTNLEELNIQSCKAVTDLGLVKLTHLSKLRVLNISGLRSVTSNGVNNGICRNVNRTLNDLDVALLNLDEHCIMNMSEKLPELRDLNVSYCDDGVTDASIQAIFKNQKWLRFLDLRNCDRISDAGLTGLEKCDLSNQNERNKLLPLSRNDNSPHKRKMASKAENDTLRDAAQKNRDVIQMSENISDDTNSLARLKGLRDLDLCGCKQITDVTLKYAFKLKELVSLDLKYCPKITDKGMAFLVRNCPSIETLKLKHCDQINDEAVAIIAKGLRRLKKLRLNGCELLTAKSLEAIRTHCKCLQSLQMGDDRDDFLEVKDSMARQIKTLRKFDLLK